MTFTRSQLSPSESAEVVKTLASQGFHLIMEMARAELNYSKFQIGEGLTELPETTFRDSAKSMDHITPEAIRARELSVVVRHLERLSTTDRDEFTTITIT